MSVAPDDCTEKHRLLTHWPDYAGQQNFTTDHLLQLAVADGLIEATATPYARQTSEQPGCTTNTDQSAAEKQTNALYLYPPHRLASIKYINIRTGDLLHLDAIMQWLADKYHLPFRHISLAGVDKTLAARLLPHRYAAHYGIVVLSAQLQHQLQHRPVTYICIASSTPFNQIWRAHLRQLYPEAVIEPVLAVPEEINSLIQSVYLRDQAGLNPASEPVQTEQQDKNRHIWN